MRYAPQEKIFKREVAENIALAAKGFEGALPGVRVEDKRQGPPRLHDLPSLQKALRVALRLERSKNAGCGPGALRSRPVKEDHHLPPRRGSLPAGELDRGCTEDRGRSSGGTVLQDDPRPGPAPIICRGASGHCFTTRDSMARAITPLSRNVNTADTLREVWPRLSIDEKKLFDVIARAYLAAVMPDFRYRQTTAMLDVRGFPFKAIGRQPMHLGWRAAFPEWQPADEKGDDAQIASRRYVTARLHSCANQLSKARRRGPLPATTRAR